MNKIRQIGYLVLGTSLVFGVAACGSTGDDKDIQGGIDPGKQTEVNTELTTEQKKLELDKTAKRALAMVKSTDFNDIENISNYVNDNLSSEHATAKISKWWEDKLESLWTDLGKRENDMKVMQQMINLSQINGHFKVVNGQWVREDAKDLQLVFNDNNGKECVLKLVLSGKQTNMYVPFLDDEEWERNDDGQFEEVKKETKFNIPEHATLTLTQGGNTLMTCELNTKVSTNGTLDVAKDNIEANCKLTINNYVVEVKRALFEAAKGAKAEATVTIGNQKLFNMVISANGKSTNERIQGVGEVSMALDILGDVQFKSKIDDGSAFYKWYTKLEENGMYTNGKFVYYTESEYKDFVKQANSHLNAGLFLKGSEKRSATIELGAFAENRYDYYEKKPLEVWTYKTMLKFDDKTSYAFEDYFTKENFPDVYKQASDLIKSFERMFNK